MSYIGIDNLVSIIMPTYNCGDFIEETIQSVRNQDYYQWELIVVDDCSSDATKDIVLNLASQDFRIKYFVLNENKGAAHARNYGLEKANGEFIAFLDSDDLWVYNKLSVQIEFMKKSDIVFSCTYYNKIDEKGNDLGKVIKNYEKIDYNSLLLNPPGNSTVIYNARFLGEKKKIPDIKKRNDYLMWLKIIKKCDNLYCLDHVLASHRIRRGSLSKNKISLVKYHWKIYFEIENMSIIKSTYLTLYWIGKSLPKLFKKI